jgi:hypothetical protein
MTTTQPARGVGTPTRHDRHAPRARHTPLGRVLALSFGVAAIAGVLVLAFSWPAVTAEPHDVPVAVAGPEPAVEQVRATLDEAQPGVVDVVPVADRDAAVKAIEARGVFGAVVLGKSPEVLTASAASTATNQLLTGIAARLQAPVTDVVPLAPDDPRGTGLAAAMFPLVIGGMLGGVAIALVVVGTWRRMLAIAAYAAAGGIALTAILQSWFGVLQGDWWADAGAIALALSAIAAPIVGFAALLGRAGIAAGAVLVLLVGNPISGATMPPEFLPGHWGAVGQWFPPGAGATLVRDLSYFPAADASAAWLALGLWAGVGTLLTLVGHLRTAGGAEPDAHAALDA